MDFNEARYNLIVNRAEQIWRSKYPNRSAKTNTAALQIPKYFRQAINELRAEGHKV